MYNFDLTTLLRLLQQFRYTGQFHAQLPPRALGLDNGRTFIVTTQGTVTSCVITNQQGQVAVSGQQALYFLNILGILHWQMEQVPAAINQAAQSQMNHDQPRIPGPVTPPTLPAISDTTGPLLQVSMPRLNAIRPSRTTDPEAAVTRPLSRTTDPAQNIPSDVTRLRSHATDPLPLTAAQANNQLVGSLQPRRSVAITTPMLNSLPRQLRRVLVLIDSKRTVAKIASILYPNNGSNEIADIVEILNELERMGLIRITN